MKRRDLLGHLRRHGCRFLREGSNHSIWVNPANNRRAPIGRHREIPEAVVKDICKQLGIPEPS